MPLSSDLFRENKRLQDCLVKDPSHVTKGDIGEHVHLIQAALIALEDAEISHLEWKETRYGESTANAVLDYKRKRNIINFSYQTQADNIVGKMTIASLDNEILAMQRIPVGHSPRCWRRR